MRRIFLLALMLGASACGDHNNSPTAPSALAVPPDGPSTATKIGAASDVSVRAHIVHPVQFGMIQGLVVFPPRNEPNLFFQDLQVLYRDTLRRTQTSTFVDSEGQNVWLTEYFRFYLNGCSHEEASSRTLTEIASGATLPTCGAENLTFPPRNLPNDFQNRLQTAYRDVLGRPPTSTYVDSEGANVWLAQYLRFRVVGNCDHTSAESRVFTEIRGGGVQSDCRSTSALGPLTGTWVGGGFFTNGTLTLQITQSGSSLTGTWTETPGGPSGMMSGSVNGSSVSMTFTLNVNTGDCTFPLRVTATANANANQMTGTYSTVSCSFMLTGSISLAKQ